MKFIHLSDLHLGKRVNDFPMIEDQRFILERILEIIHEEKPKAVLIAGDVYDKPLPPAEAVKLFDDFISRLSKTDAEVFIISGNHDSAERLADDGKAEEIATYTDAVAFAIDKMGVDENERNVLIAHQFCTGAQRSESEDINVGGLDNVDASVFGPFDYTALGHLHGPQNAGDERVRYCGSPLKYSFSEADQIKSVTIVELGEKKDGACAVHLRTPELVSLRNMKVLRGSFSELTDKNYYKHIETDDYMRIILTDEEDVIGALGSLRAIYPYIMRLEYDNTRTRSAAIVPDAEGNDGRTPLEIFDSLYEAQNGRGMDEEQSRVVSSLIEKVWGDEK